MPSESPEQLHSWPRATVIIGCGSLIVDGDGYLLVRESKPSARSRFNLPAGKPEVGETLVETAIREAKEETGLDVVADFIVGLYYCPQTSEGFGVLNIVFATTVVGGAVVTTIEHPEVRYFTRPEIAELGRNHLLRGTHIELAVDAHTEGQRLPLELVQPVSASPLPRA